MGRHRRRRTVHRRRTGSRVPRPVHRTRTRSQARQVANLPVSRAPQPDTVCDLDPDCGQAATWTVVSDIADEEGRQTYFQDVCLTHLPEALLGYELWVEESAAGDQPYSWRIEVRPYEPEPPQPEPETCVHGLSAWLCEDPVNHYPPDHYPF